MDIEGSRILHWYHIEIDIEKERERLEVEREEWSGWKLYWSNLVKYVQWIPIYTRGVKE